MMDEQDHGAVHEGPVDEDAIMEREEAAYLDRIERLEQENAALRDEMTRDELDTVLRKVGIEDRTFRRSATSMLLEGGIADEEDLGAAVVEWATTDEALAFLPATGAAGGGASGTAASLGSPRPSVRQMTRAEKVEYIRKYGVHRFKGLVRER